MRAIAAANRRTGRTRRPQSRQYAATTTSASPVGTHQSGQPAPITAIAQSATTPASSAISATRGPPRTPNVERDSGNGGNRRSGMVCAGNGIVGGEQGVLTELSFERSSGGRRYRGGCGGTRPVGPVMSRAQVQGRHDSVTASPE